MAIWNKKGNRSVMSHEEDHSDCPLNSMQAAKLIANDEKMMEVIHGLDKRLDLIMQDKSAKETSFEKRLQSIEENQACIIKNMQEYKKYLFAGSVVVSIFASLGAAAYALWNHSADIAQAIKSYIIGNEVVEASRGIDESPKE